MELKDVVYTIMSRREFSLAGKLNLMRFSVNVKARNLVNLEETSLEIDLNHMKVLQTKRQEEQERQGRDRFREWVTSLEMKIEIRLERLSQNKIQKSG